MLSDAKESWPRDAIGWLLTVKAEKFASHVLWYVAEAHQGTYHATNDAGVGVCIASFLDCLSHRNLVQLGFSVLELAGDFEEVETQHEGVSEPALLMSTIDDFFREILVCWSLLLIVVDLV